MKGLVRYCPDHDYSTFSTNDSVGGVLGPDGSIDIAMGELCERGREGEFTEPNSFPNHCD